MTTRTITNEPLTGTEAVAHLLNLYRIAATTGFVNSDPHYQELAGDIHATIISIMHGIDPTEALADLADAWRAVARDTPDGETAARTYRWVAYVAHLVKP